MTVLLPTGKTEKDAGLHRGVSTPSTSSTAATLNPTIAPDASSLWTVMLEGTVTTGGVTSACALTLPKPITTKPSTENDNKSDISFNFANAQSKLCFGYIYA